MRIPRRNGLAATKYVIPMISGRRRLHLTPFIVALVLSEAQSSSPPTSPENQPSLLCVSAVGVVLIAWVAESGWESDRYKALRSGEWTFKVSPICLPLCFLILPTSFGSWVGGKPDKWLFFLMFPNNSSSYRTDLGSGGVTPVGVRVPPFAPFVFNTLWDSCCPPQKASSFLPPAFLLLLPSFDSLCLKD